MKNKILTFALVFFGSFSLFSQISTTTQSQVSGYAINSCNGDWLYINGMALSSYSYYSSGQLQQNVYNLQFFAKGQASSLSTVGTYKINFGSDNLTFVGKPGQVVDIPVSIPLIGQPGFPSLVLNGKLQIAVKLNGQLVPQLIIFSIGCN